MAKNYEVHDPARAYDLIEVLNPFDTDFHYKYNNEEKILPAGSRTSLPRFLAIYAVKKIVDRQIIDDPELGIKKKNSPIVRESFEKKLWFDATNREQAKEVIAETSDVKNLQDLHISQIRTIASGKGLKFLNTTKKKELIQMINGQD